jgi:5-methylcytosine-specific restriction endonuclease McrA
MDSEGPTLRDSLEALLIQNGVSKFWYEIKQMSRRRLQNPGREKRKNIPEALKRTLYAKQGGRCNECQEQIEYTDMKGDHIDCNRQDFNARSNWQLLCGPCNAEKAAKSVYEQSKESGKTFPEILNP